MFSVVKIVGAAYLIALGIRTLLEHRDDGVIEVSRASMRRVYAQGFVVEVFNPKTALFFLAFLPQFVDPSRGAAPPQLVLLGLVFVALGMVSDGTYSLVASRIGARLTARPGSRGTGACSRVASW